jgi:hypothetical protein
MKEREMRNARLIFVFLVALLGLLLAVPALAHGSTQVGDYELVIGFSDEPALQGEPNGLDLFVTDTRTNERVNGLEQTLQAELTFGASSRTFDLRPQFGQDGAYTAYVLPTEPGDYTWRIFGEIEGTPVDVSMTSSPDTFSSVGPKAGISFPGEEPATADLSAGLASSGRTAQIALFLGVAGVLLGAVSLFTSLRARSK